MIKRIAAWAFAALVMIAPALASNCGPTAEWIAVANKYPASTVTQLDAQQARLYVLGLMANGFSAPPMTIERISGAILIEVPGKPSIFLGIIEPGDIICSTAGVPRQIHNSLLKMAVTP